MKTFLLAGVAAILAAGCASAADIRIPSKAPYAAPIAPFSWSGCHLGSHTGLAAAHTRWADAVTDGAIDGNALLLGGPGTGHVATTDMSGAIYGGQIGCDWSFSGNWVVGLEGSLSGSTLSGTNMDQFNSTWALRSRNGWMGSVTGRFGYSVERVLLYWRGGIAWANTKFEIENSGFFDGAPSVTRTGWVLGSGIEWAFAPSWSVFLEADYYNFGNASVNFIGDAFNPTPAFAVRTSQTIESLKLGVNYRFGDGGGVIARY
jgi:outer membrane immunogenic protein